MNLVYNVCSIVTCPVEMALRPQYGSRYFPPIIMFFSAVDDDRPADFLSAGGGLLPHDSLRPLRRAIGHVRHRHAVQALLPGLHGPWAAHMAAHAAYGAGGEQRL